MLHNYFIKHDNSLDIDRGFFSGCVLISNIFLDHSMDHGNLYNIMEVLMKIMVIIGIFLSFVACDNINNNSDNSGNSCSELDVEFAQVGINNACGPRWDRRRAYFANGTLCLKIFGDDILERSMWLSTDGTLIRMNITYESIEGWSNVSRESEYSFWVDFTYLSDEYCSNFEGDSAQCLYEGCAPLSRGMIVTLENDTCQFDATILCVYNIDGDCTGEYYGMICEQSSDRVVRQDIEGYPSGWNRCDLMEQCF
jgi:hypothetical protein